MKGTKAFLFTILPLFATVAAFGQSVTYNFKPPQNNFYIKWEDADGNTQFHGYINGGLWYSDPDGALFFTSASNYYYNDGRRWYPDDMLSASEVRERITSHLAEPEMLGVFFTSFWNRYNTALEGISADLYHRGQERFLGINCDIFVDNMNRRYWIDPSNGCTLKMANANGAVVYEVTEYNLNFTSWPAGLPPR